MPGSRLQSQPAPPCSPVLLAPAHRLKPRSPPVMFLRPLWLCSPPGRPLAVNPLPPSQWRVPPISLPCLLGCQSPSCTPLPWPPLGASLRGPRRRRPSLRRLHRINFHFAPSFHLTLPLVTTPLASLPRINSHGILPPLTPSSHALTTFPMCQNTAMEQ